MDSLRAVMDTLQESAISHFDCKTIRATLHLHSFNNAGVDVIFIILIKLLSSAATSIGRRTESAINSAKPLDMNRASNNTRSSPLTTCILITPKPTFEHCSPQQGGVGWHGMYTDLLGANCGTNNRSLQCPHLSHFQPDIEALEAPGQLSTVKKGSRFHFRADNQYL
uniref:Uncharacterized protein n=1 Tax=Opuntia streptacantha TaxID=393608 RepID=A0A7C9ABU4_OPUST